GPPPQGEDLGSGSLTPFGTGVLAAELAAQHAFAAWPAAHHALQVIVSKMVPHSTIRSRSMEKNHV
ncbi:MAG: hypothetical protein IE937_12420, partial [Gammaproteobacteria bacterium]|nr:hypothetical protein [Gammaproteobacteria bacterium]